MNRPRVKTALIVLLAALVASFGFAQSTLEHYQPYGISLAVPMVMPFCW